MHRYAKAVGAIFAAATLVLSGCATPTEDEGSASSTASLPAEEKPGMHTPVSAEGVTLTVESAYQTDSMEMQPESGYIDDLVMEEARENGAFIVVETTVENNSTGDMDLTCFYTGPGVDAQLSTDPEATYQPFQALHRIPGNPECNENLGAGFDTSMTWLFQIPEDSAALSFGFAHSDEGSRGLTWIELDQLTEEAPGPETPPEDAAAEDHAPRPTPPHREPTEGLPVGPAGPVDQHPVEPPAPEAPTAPAAPVYGAPCTEAQLLQPAVDPSGADLACIASGGPPTWVYSAGSPQGSGTANPGGACEGDEVGGQDEAGRMMMCINGEWIYGP